MIFGLGGTTPIPATGEKMDDDERATNRDRGNEEQGIDVIVLLGVGVEKEG